jgi:hypothetical protein
MRPWAASGTAEDAGEDAADDIATASGSEDFLRGGKSLV